MARRWLSSGYPEIGGLIGHDFTFIAVRESCRGGVYPRPTHRFRRQRVIDGRGDGH